MRKFPLMASVLLGLALPSISFAQGDGPRTYMLVPDDTTLYSVYYFHMNGNQTADPSLVIPKGDLDIDLAAAMYTQTFDIGGKQGAYFGILPYGQIDGSLSAYGRSLDGSASGFGDLTLGAILGVYNSPNLSLQDYATRPVTPNMGVLAKLTLPTGNYSSDQVLNLGSNRWSLQLGLPMAYYIGSSMVDPRLTSFELTPSVIFFSDNDNPTGGASSLSQDALFQLEAHITHNLNSDLWVSFDALQTYGGETSLDGLSNDDKQHSFAVGATVNYALNKTSFVKASYGRTVVSNESGASGNMLRIQLGFAH